MSVIDRILTLPQHVAPHHRLSQLAWRIARSENQLFKNLLIRGFMWRYDIDLSEAERTDIADYNSFNDFFTRALRPGSRPLSSDATAIVGPADGTISQIGAIDGERLLQAKGRYYSIGALLADSSAAPRRYTGGSFATIYLAPHNYHRVHAPVAGTISRVAYIPGRLFSVNDRTARCVDNLFARNERIIVEMQSSIGEIAVILVGAMLVSSMELTCCDVAAALQATSDATTTTSIDLSAAPCAIELGAELGRFNMGSTVILLAPAGRLTWASELEHGVDVRVGQTIATPSAG